MNDLVLSVGGDGTFLETVMKVKDLGVPIAGVNTGRMGFLANISADENRQFGRNALQEGVRDIERCLLEISEPASLFEANYSHALNEVTIQMCFIKKYIDGDHAEISLLNCDLIKCM